LQTKGGKCVTCGLSFTKKRQPKMELLGQYDAQKKKLHMNLEMMVKSLDSENILG
jgi:hypothetical protein